MTEIFNGGLVVETILPVSVPSGGTTGQALVKKSNASFDMKWSDVATGGGGGGVGDMLKSVYDPNDDGKISYSDLSDKPTLGTAAPLNVPSVGDASSGEIVKGSDTRLTNARIPLSHTHSINEVSGLSSALSAKQEVLSGTGLVRVAGTSITYDNSSYLTGINSSQVTSALGYVPYNSTNPNGYTTNLGTVTATSVSAANGFLGTVSNATTTPIITISTQVTGLLKGTGTGLASAVSGTDIKTVGGVSLLGSGDIAVGGTGTVTSFAFNNGNGFTGTVGNSTTSPSLSLSLQNASTSQSGQLTSTDWNTFNGKQATLVSGTNIKTVNGASVLGSGDITISGGSGSVTTISIASANGLAGSITNPTTTPAITLSTSITGIVKANGTAFTPAVAGTDYLLPTGSGAALTGVTVSQVSGAAPLASPTFTGVPLGTTAAVDTSTTQLATTAYVVNQGYLKSATAASTYATTASLGTASAGVLTTSTTDTTTGRVTKVGDYGIGTAPISSDNWNTVTASGKYRNTLTSATGIPEATVGLLMTNTYIDSNTATQLAWNTATGGVYTRNKASGTWGSWSSAVSGGVTTVSVVSANGLNGSVATSTSTPAITLGTSITGLLKGNGTAISAVVSGTDIKTINGSSILGSGDLVISGGGGGSGTVTTVSVATANGFAGTISNATTTPAITISTTATGMLKGNGTVISAATAGTDYLAPSNLTSSSTDTTAGKVLKVGDYGLGTAPVNNDNWDTVTASGRYINTSTGATGIPTALSGLLLIHTYIDASTATQVSWDTLNNRMYTRRKTSGTYGAWTAGASAAGITRTVAVTSGSFTAGSAIGVDYVYLIAGAHPPTLPTAVGNTNMYTFKNNHSVAVTIATTSAQTIDGTTTLTLSPQASVDVISTGSNWSVI